MEPSLCKVIVSEGIEVKMSLVNLCDCEEPYKPSIGSEEGEPLSYVRNLYLTR